MTEKLKEFLQYDENMNEISGPRLFDSQVIDKGLALTTQLYRDSTDIDITRIKQNYIDRKYSARAASPL